MELIEIRNIPENFKYPYCVTFLEDYDMSDGSRLPKGTVLSTDMYLFKTEPGKLLLQWMLKYPHKWHGSYHE